MFKVELHVQADFFAEFTFAQRARCAAAILLRALADIVRFLGIVTTFAFSPFAFTFAQRALLAAAILTLPAADIPPRGAVPFPYAAPKAESAALIAFISLVNRSCSFFNICTTPPRFVIDPRRGDCSRQVCSMSVMGIYRQQYCNEVCATLPSCPSGKSCLRPELAQVLKTLTGYTLRITLYSC